MRAEAIAQSFVPLEPKKTSIVLGLPKRETASQTGRFVFMQSRTPSAVQRWEEKLFKQIIVNGGLEPLVVRPLSREWQGKDILSTRSPRTRGESPIVGGLIGGSAYIDLAVVTDPQQVKTPITQEIQDRVDIYLSNTLPFIKGFIDAGLVGGGLCLGDQLFNHALGRPVRRVEARSELGTATQRLTSEGRVHPVTTGLGWEEFVYSGHKDSSWYDLSEMGLYPVNRILATTDRDPNSMKLFTENILGTGIHPEVRNQAELDMRKAPSKDGLKLEPYAATYEYRTPSPNAWRLLANIVNGARNGSLENVDPVLYRRHLVLAA